MRCNVILATGTGLPACAAGTGVMPVLAMLCIQSAYMLCLPCLLCLLHATG